MSKARRSTNRSQRFDMGSSQGNVSANRYRAGAVKLAGSKGNMSVFGAVSDHSQRKITNARVRRGQNKARVLNKKALRVSRTRNQPQRHRQNTNNRGVELAVDFGGEDVYDNDDEEKESFERRDGDDTNDVINEDDNENEDSNIDDDEDDDYEMEDCGDDSTVKEEEMYDEF